MAGLAPIEAVLLVGVGLLAGVVNTLAGGGSLVTVPLLVMLGLPGNLANGTNRVGIFFQCLAAARGFHARGALDLRAVLPVFVPVACGSLLGALCISQVADATFERLFGVLMLLLLVPLLGGVGPRPDAPARAGRRWVSALLYLGIGLYAGAFQAGVGVPLLFALLYNGHDLVRANALKVSVVALATGAALPVFVAQGQVAWGPALLLTVGFFAGGALGVPIAMRGGERVIRPLLGVAVLALAARMLGLW